MAAYGDKRYWHVGYIGSYLEVWIIPNGGFISAVIVHGDKVGEYAGMQSVLLVGLAGRLAVWLLT